MADRTVLAESREERYISDDHPPGEVPTQIGQVLLRLQAAYPPEIRERLSDRTLRQTAERILARQERDHRTGTEARYLELFARHLGQKDAA